MSVAAILTPEKAAHSQPWSGTAPTRDPRPPVLALAAWHGLLWLSVSNAIGVGLAILLLWPRSGAWLGSWTYGRWMPVHLNLQLYGWTSLPLIAWLLRLYHADEGELARWSRAALLLWSAALAIGSIDWLNGHTSGKLFLDWSGYVRVFFPMAILFLWCVLATALALHWNHSRNRALPVRLAKSGGLVLLLLVPLAIYVAANPAIYPPVNPDSGGPTGSSQLESVLIIVLILFILPWGVTRRAAHGKRWIVLAWIAFAIEALLCLGLGRHDVSNHRSTQIISLGSLLLWVPLMPAYYSAFLWSGNNHRWRTAVLVWWAVLIPTGWCLFLPPILDRLKFTDGLVGHSLLAMAGFVTSLLVLLLTALLGEDGDVFSTRWSFIAWQAGTATYIAIMFIAGWIEGGDPAFTMTPNTTRNVLYCIRLCCGIAMTAASWEWLWQLTRRMRNRFRAGRPAWEAAP